MQTILHTPKSRKRSRATLRAEIDITVYGRWAAWSLTIHDGGRAVYRDCGSLGECGQMTARAWLAAYSAAWSWIDDHYSHARLIVGDSRADRRAA
ncbi:MAG: hypothetical protein AB1631_10180 [Acidobacteriota bacterium]